MTQVEFIQKVLGPFADSATGVQLSEEEKAAQGAFMEELGNAVPVDVIQEAGQIYSVVMARMLSNLTTMPDGTPDVAAFLRVMRESVYISSFVNFMFICAYHLGKMDDSAQFSSLMEGVLGDGEPGQD